MVHGVRDCQLRHPLQLPEAEEGAGNDSLGGPLADLNTEAVHVGLGTENQRQDMGARLHLRPGQRLLENCLSGPMSPSASRPDRSDSLLGGDRPEILRAADG